jgi:hypothetical protein
VAVGVVFALIIWVFAALRTGVWVAALREALLRSAVLALVLAAVVGPLQASAARTPHYAPILSLPFFGLSLFAAAWAAFWVLPYNLLIFAKHGFLLPLHENLTYVAVAASTGLFLSFLPVRA